MFRVEGNKVLNDAGEPINLDTLKGTSTGAARHFAWKKRAGELGFTPVVSVAKRSPQGSVQRIGRGKKKNR